MSKIVVFALIFIILGCTFFVVPRETFIIKNETNKAMKISFFSKSVLLESVEIEAHKQFQKTIKEVGRLGITSPFNNKTDSLIILFSDKKYLSQYCQGLVFYGNFGKCYYEKNLLDFASGVRLRKKISGKTTNIITFDESDYQKAKPL